MAPDHRATRTGLAWYQLSEGPLQTLDVGAVAGTDVYAPVDGTVVAIRDQIISAHKVGAEIELRPTSAPSLVVSIANVRPDPALRSARTSPRAPPSSARSSNIGRFERQALAKYAADNGNNVAIEVFPSATLGVP